jgi:catechol 2,3-dioxygenase-like lactoylglutathione lyase family enzyme
MINNISLTTVWVKDIDESKAFYVDKLGFEPHDDVRIGDDFRWCTIGHPSQPELDVQLSKPGPPLSPDYVDALNRALDDGGTFAIGLRVENCRATIAELEANGVEVLNQPEDRPYGVEALIRDNTGNWLVLVEPHEFNQEELETFAGEDPAALDPFHRQS